MSYFDALSFASGYYHIGEKGIVTLREDTPPEIRERFWRAWPAFRRKVIATEKAGLYTSLYPYLPIEDKDPNEWQYKKSNSSFDDEEELKTEELNATNEAKSFVNNIMDVIKRREQPSS